jgi:hypothetical protein
MFLSLFKNGKTRKSTKKVFICFLKMISFEMFLHFRIPERCGG